MFKWNLSTNPDEINDEVLSTRLVILICILAWVTLLIYSLISNVSMPMTVKNVSMATYNDLYDQYSLSLNCPCSKQSIPYGTFIPVSVKLHQICSSDFGDNSKQWLNYFYAAAFSWMYSFTMGGFVLINELIDLIRLK
jgi:hypothetical protein